MNQKNTLQELHTVKELVCYILATDPQSRNSDSYLYLKVIEQQAIQKSIDLRLLSVVSFFDNLNFNGFAKFESVRRARQKLQAENPHFMGSAEVQAARRNNEAVFREWAVE